MIIGIFWFNDAARLKLLAIELIIVGVVGLHLQSDHEPGGEPAEPVPEMRET